MIDAKRGDERIMRATEVNGERTSWADEGELVRCADCVNWGTLTPKYAEDWCHVVSKCTLARDWCCWGARKGENDGR